MNKQISLKKFENNKDIYPGIDDLVDVLYTDEINNLIDTKCQTSDDKRVFLMFLIMYFYNYLSIPDDIKGGDYDVKTSLKMFLTDLLKNPEKRTKCLEIYTSFENTIKLINNK